MKRGSIVNRLISLVYPETCPYCGKVIGIEDEKCDKCREEIKYTVGLREIYEDVLCMSPFSYKEKVREAVRKFKFEGQKRYAWNFAYEIVKFMKIKFADEKFSFVTSVPLHEEREKKRGYNQSYALSQEISEFLGIENRIILKKVKNNPPQYKMENFVQRSMNVNGVYKVLEIAKDKGKILLCDDVIASGSTLLESVKVLKKAGFKDILCVSIASV